MKRVEKHSKENFQKSNSKSQKSSDCNLDTSFSELAKQFQILEFILKIRT